MCARTEGRKKDEKARNALIQRKKVRDAIEHRNMMKELGLDG